jgi:RNA polymerase sigma-70 factor (ECF subfamily)
VQEAFARLWERRDMVDPDRSIKAYLYATTRNLALNHLRNTATRKTLLDQMDPTHDDASAPDEALRTDQMRLRLQGWIDELPARRREAFELSRFCDLSHAEVAQVMGLTVHTVEKHITEALRHLRDRLRTLDPDFLKS